MRKAIRRLQALVRETIASIEDRSLVRAELRSVRLKALKSVLRKAEKNGWAADDALWLCGDLIGGRVVCNNVEDVYRFVELLREHLPSFPGTVDVQDQIAQPNPAGYRAVHINFGLDVGNRPFAPDIVPCEIQVRSRLQDAWAELSHDDIYKADRLPEDLRARLSDMATTLAAADRTASAIRQRVMTVVTPPARRPNLARVTAKGIAHIFSQAFGRSPPDYLVRQANGLAQELKVGALSPVAAMLEDVQFRESVASAYSGIMPVRISNEDTFLAAIRAAGSGKEWAISEVTRLAREEWNEIDQLARREALSSLPDRIEDFVAQIEAFDSGSTMEWAEALGATNGCLVCGNTVVDSYALAQAAVDYYQANGDHFQRIETAVLQSDCDTGGYGDGSLCAYHNEQAGRED
jgi:ppGpp synthetase/RelA/SpoT-type nucleotidyltranferase